MSKKLLLFLAEGFEIIEAFAVVDLCRRAGLNIQTVSISGDRTVLSSHKVPVVADMLLAGADFDEADMLILPGGMPGTLHLEECKPLMDKLDEFYAQGRYISAICAAPSIFAHRGYLKNRPACSFPSFEKDLAAGGAIVNQNEVTVCDHLTMARGMGCAIPFGLAIVERFCGEETAKQLKATIVYEQR